MLLYLDLNCFNRPFDDQTQDRVVRETSAVFAVLRRIDAGVDQLAWSAVLDFENAQHPLPDRCREIAHWGRRASVNVAVDQRVAARTQLLNDAGIKPLDAAHVACAEAGRCDRFLTCDDRLLRVARARRLSVIVQNPRDYLEECDHA